MKHKFLIYFTGTASIMYLIVFVVIKSASWGVNMSKVEWAMSWAIQPTFPALSGLLAMSFFIHNIVINIMQNNRDQEKNVSYFKSHFLTVYDLLVEIK